MSNKRVAVIEALIDRNVNILQATIALLDNSRRLLHEEPEKAPAEFHRARAKLDEAIGPLTKLADDVRHYQALHFRAISLLVQLGHKSDERGFAERLEGTLDALDRR